MVEGLLVQVEGSHISAVSRAATPAPDAVRLPGLTVPGFANCHSHAFHRALRGRTQRERGTFWTWRDQMYDVAARLEPDSYYDLALATYQEMALAGITAVGEFHYLHHGQDGTRYGDPNAMGEAVVAAARDAGLRITLLDTCYLAAGFERPPEGVQTRFSDGSAEGWAARVADLSYSSDRGVVLGAAIHSVRAVPRPALPTVAAALPASPLHIHLSEQVNENADCLHHHGVSPTKLLADSGALDSRTTAVHATHLGADDVRLLGAARVQVCFCPTTERDLADGIGPSRQLVGAGATLTLGSDSHAVIDMCEEMRAVELDERLASRQRGHWQSSELLSAATQDGHRSLGFVDAGRIEPGCWADLVTFDLQSPRTAGTGGGAESVVFAASAADITGVVASGQLHELDGEGVGRRLSRAVDAVVETR